MKTLAIYALEVLACSGVLLAAYAILLERHVRFGWCRAYLLASTLLAAVIRSHCPRPNGPPRWSKRRLRPSRPKRYAWRYT